MKCSIHNLVILFCSNRKFSCTLEWFADGGAELQVAWSGNGESRGWLMTGWDGWLMNREAGCQCKPVIEGGCEPPPWIYNVPWQLQHSTGCLQGASSSHNMLLQTGLLYVSVSCFKQKCIEYENKYEINGQFTYVMYISSVNNVLVKLTAG